MKAAIILAALLTGCAQQPTYTGRTYYPSLSGSTYNRTQPDIHTYWIYSGNRLTPVIQSGPIIMPLGGF